MMNLTSIQIEKFLFKVDRYFPVPLSHKQDLKCYAKKLQEKATVCAEVEDGNIVAMAAGYTVNLTDNIGYLSVVAVDEVYRGKGLASKLIKEFIEICESKKIDAVHLYTDSGNKSAIAMYHKIGFKPYVVDNEPRPGDVHLIYYINKETE